MLGKGGEMDPLGGRRCDHPPQDHGSRDGRGSVGGGRLPGGDS